MAAEVQGVIERMQEQLQLAGKVRGYKKAIYREVGRGKKELVHYARQMLHVQSADILELCELAKANGRGADPIVLAQKRGHEFSLMPGNAGEATMQADDVFYLIDLAKPLFVPAKIIVPGAAS